MYTNKKYDDNSIRKQINNGDSIKWGSISYYSDLSEDFMKEFKNNINWSNACMMQDMSEEFIIEMKDYVDWRELNRVGKLKSKQLIQLSKVYL